MNALDVNPPAYDIAQTRDILLMSLRKDFQPLYAILDAARDIRVLAALLRSGSQYESLYEGVQGDSLAQVAPYLVRLPEDSDLLEILVHEGWGNSWGIYLTCPGEFGEVRRHLRRFLEARLPDGKDVYFRFYDPRVLRVFLPTCTSEDATQFFGPIQNYLVEDEDQRKLIRFVSKGKGSEKAIIGLDPTVKVEEEVPETKSS